MILQRLFKEYDLELIVESNLKVLTCLDQSSNFNGDTV